MWTPFLFSLQIFHDRFSTIKIVIIYLYPRYNREYLSASESTHATGTATLIPLSSSEYPLQVRLYIKVSYPRSPSDSKHNCLVSSQISKVFDFGSSESIDTKRSQYTSTKSLHTGLHDSAIDWQHSICHTECAAIDILMNTDFIISYSVIIIEATN